MTGTVLITGACGNVGQKLTPHLAKTYVLRLLDRTSKGNPQITVLDLSEWSEALETVCTGVDTLIHLAADPNESASWETLVSPNLDALNNTFSAAMKAKVPRVIYASSNHVMGGYKDAAGVGRWLTTALPQKPGTRFEWPEGNHRDSTPYGSMKLYGERLGRCYAQTTGGVCIALRIGWVNGLGQNRPEDLPVEANTWFKQMWLSTPDLCQLMDRAIVAPLPAGSFHVLNGMSNNDGMVWDLESTRQILGYEPEDGVTADFKDKKLV